MTHLRGVKPALSPDREPLTKEPKPPKWLTAEARTEWKRIMPRLIADRIITAADLAGVENYCTMQGHIRQLERAIAASPVPDKVLFGMLNRAMQTARQLAAEYGLTPTSRARVGSNAADDDGAPNPLTIGRNRR